MLTQAFPIHFVFENKDFILALATSKKTKILIFKLFYDYYLEWGKDEQIFNILVLWNVELDIVES